MTRDFLRQTFVNSGLVAGGTATAIADTFIEKRLSRGELHLQEGKVCPDYFFLEEGFMRAYAHDVEGREVTTAFFAKGGLVFEVASFFHRTPSKENIQALTDCSGWSISYTQLNELFHTLPEFREFGRSVLVKGFAALKERTLSMITETAEERYARLLQTAPEIFQLASLKYIASYLGVTDTSLSRIRHGFAKK